MILHLQEAEQEINPEMSDLDNAKLSADTKAR